MFHSGVQEAPVRNIVMEGFGEIGRPAVGFGEDHLDVVEVPYCPWDG